MTDKKLKKYVFDAGNSNTGVAGVVIAARAYSRKSAVRVANEFLRHFEPLDIQVKKPGGSGGEVGDEWALFCVGPKLRRRDIDDDSVLA